jgi:dimethylamine--corrinoid protein Co-methyltransferase
MEKFFTRMGDGFGVYLSEEEIREDIRAGAVDAADRGKIPALTEAEMDHLYRIITMEGIIVGVKHGDEVVSSTDQGADTCGCESGVPIDRAIQVQLLERAFGLDSTDYGFTDYNFKAVKSIANYEAASIERALENSVIPVLYG